MYRQRLLQDGQIGKAMHRAHQYSRANRQRGLEHDKGVRAKTQREGRGKVEQIDWDSMGGGRTTCSVDAKFGRQRKQKAAPNSFPGQATEVGDPARVLSEKEVQNAKEQTAAQVQLVRGWFEMKPSTCNPSAKSLREAGKLPSPRAAHVSSAAVAIRSFAKEQRPASLRALGTFLKKRGCCDLRYKVLMPPGALAHAMIPLLAGKPLLQHAVSTLTTATGADHMGPTPEMLGRSALERVQRLKMIEDDFLNWSLATRCQWLAQGSSATIKIEPQTLVTELVAQHLVIATEAGKLTYNEDLLGAEIAPLDGEWTADAFKQVTAGVVIDDLCVHLGHVEALAEVRFISFRKSGLKALAQKWKDEALKSCTSPNFAVVHASFEPRRWPISLRIVTAVLGVESSAAASFKKEVRKAVETDIRSISPLVLELRDLTLRQSLFEDERSQISWLEKNLGCRLAASGNHDLWAVFPLVDARNISQERVDKYREVLRRAVSDEPVFMWPWQKPLSYRWTTDDGTDRADVTGVMHVNGWDGHGWTGRTRRMIRDGTDVDGRDGWEARARTDGKDVDGRDGRDGWDRSGRTGRVTNGTDGTGGTDGKDVDGRGGRGVTGRTGRTSTKLAPRCRFAKLESESERHSES